MGALLQKTFLGILRARRGVSCATGQLWLRVHSLAGSIVVGQNVVAIGVPSIHVNPGCKIVVGDRVTLNSVNIGYHLNMHSPVKLMVDGQNAVIEIGSDSRLNGVCVHARERISIGRRCLIAANTQIMDCSGHDLAEDHPEGRICTKGKPAPVIIEDDVWIGASTHILPGVRIGRGTVIAAGSVVQATCPTWFWLEACHVDQFAA